MNTLASLFQDDGRIFRDVDRMNREAPLNWIDQLSETKPEGFKNGKWAGDGLNQIARRLTLEALDVLGQLKVTGNPECMVGEFGETCQMSALPWIFGEDTKVTPEKFCKVEDQMETWDQAKILGQEINTRFKTNGNVIWHKWNKRVMPHMGWPAFSSYSRSLPATVVGNSEIKKKGGRHVKKNKTPYSMDQ